MGRKFAHSKRTNTAVAAMILLFSSLGLQANSEINTIMQSGIAQNKAGANSQKKIDKISEETEKIIAKYHVNRKNVERKKLHNDRFRRSIKAQENEMQNLQRSIEEAALIERQIVPLMLRMVDSLEKYIQQDMPFQRAERLERVGVVKGFLTNANISASERMRQVLAEYKNETAYGNSVNVYTETIDNNGEELTGYILQVGRVGLYFQTLDGANSMVWNKEAGQWDSLDSSRNEGIAHAIKITQGKVSSDLMELPIQSPVKQ